MFIVGLLSWWYGPGWARQLGKTKERIAATADYFSIDLLARTLFMPFRQISAGKVDGPLAVRWRAFLDRLVSRCIGAAVRIVMILIGIIGITFFSLAGGIVVALWAFVPIAPLIGVVLMAIGWTPSWM